MLSSPWVIAHVVGERPPTLLSWLLGALFAFGAVAAILTTGRLRKVMALVAVAGVVASVWDVVERGVRPAAPDLRITLASPGAVTDRPVLVQLCGHTRSGVPENPVAGGRWFLVRVDGVQMAEVHATRIELPLTAGHHLLFVEINSPYHQQYQPAVFISRQIVVKPRAGVSLGHC